MGVHTQGESGFFDEDTELPLEQNEIIEQHETANSDTVGKSATINDLYILSPIGNLAAFSLDKPFYLSLTFKISFFVVIHKLETQVQTCVVAPLSIFFPPPEYY